MWCTLCQVATEETMTEEVEDGGDSVVVLVQLVQGMAALMTVEEIEEASEGGHVADLVNEGEPDLRVEVAAT